MKTIGSNGSPKTLSMNKLASENEGDNPNNGSGLHPSLQ